MKESEGSFSLEGQIFHSGQTRAEPTLQPRLGTGTVQRCAQTSQLRAEEALSLRQLRDEQPARAPPRANLAGAAAPDYPVAKLPT